MIKMGAFAYLMKPFNMETIEERVAQAVEHRRQLLNQ
jgi:response regulator of citrate/malate metabolism